MKRKIILVGGGGHCRSVIDVIEAEAKFEIAGIVDVKEKVGTDISGYKIIATDNELKDLVKEFSDFHVTVGHVKSNKVRVHLFNELKKMGAQLPVIRSPFAHISKHAVCGQGSIIMHHAILNAGTVVGENCIINSKALIEHDAVVANHVHVSTGAIINGNCQVCENVFIGTGAIVSNNVSIIDDCIIGAGSVVIKDVLKAGTYVGNPAKLRS